jgi:hypothetical protein
LPRATHAAPPQSRPVSSPSIAPLLQVSVGVVTAHVPVLHRPVAQSLSTKHDRSNAQRWLHVKRTEPPQSMSVSSPSCSPL